MRRASPIPSLLRTATALATLLVASRGDAEPSAADRASAEALFQQGTDLMAEKRLAAACEKFEGSQQLDPALGTMLRLADCYDRAGKTASAWALFREAVSLARTRGEPDRERISNERAADLEKRLSKLEIRIDKKNAPAGIEVQLNGTAVPRASWDTPMPVDPGRQRISVSAPERVGWSTTVDVATSGDLKTVEIPALAAKPKSDSPDAVSLGLAGPTRDAPSSGMTARSIGYVAGSLGIVGVVAGGFLTYRAYGAKQDSLDHCRYEDPNACTPEGKSLRDRAKGFADGATIAFVAGGALLATSVVLVLTSRSSEPRHPALKASAAATPGGGGIQLEGTW